MDAPVYFLSIKGVTAEITHMINPQSKASCGLFACIELPGGLLHIAITVCGSHVINWKRE